MKVFDRLETQYSHVTVMDAMVMVEISDPDDVINVDDGSNEGRDFPATIILLESTNDRVTVQAGMLRFASRNLFVDADDD